LSSIAQLRIEIFGENNAALDLTAGGSEAVKLHGRMELHRAFLRKGNDIVAGKNRVAAVFDLGNRHSVARVHNLNPGELCVGLSGSSYNGPLARIQFIAIGIPQLPYHAIFLAEFVTGAFQEHDFALRELRRERRFQPAGDKLASRNDGLADEAGA